MMIFFQWVPDYLFPSVCAAPNWLLHLGFSLGYFFCLYFCIFTLVTAMPVISKGS